MVRGARQAVGNLTLQQKVSVATGVGTLPGDCIGNTATISSINFPGLCLEDSPLGVRDTDGNSAFPAGINAAATFNRTLMNQRGVAMAQEFRAKGVNVQLGPMMNLMRIPASGRAWEGFGGDPCLSGEGAYETIRGIQSQGVQAVAKHLINNEQEHSRTSSSSNVDDRTQHELYLHPFLRSVQANVAAVMCSYNQINESYACENNATLNGLLKNELAFQGFVVSDCYFGDALVQAVNQGTVPESRVDDMATRIFAAWYLLGQDQGIIREIGAASTVLLKNEAHALPLRSPATIAIIGSGAGSNFFGPNSCIDRSCDNGVLGMGWGSGSANYPYLIAPMDAITNRSKTDNTTITSSLSDSDLNAAANAASGKEVAFVFITADSGEDGYTVEGNAGDRNDLQAWHGGDALVEKVASVNNNTVVVVNTVGPIVVEAWIDNPNVTALVWSGLPGQEAGNSLVDVLYGNYNPSARLPYTIGKSINDYPAQIDTTVSTSTVQINYTEGLFIDYRHFDALVQANIAPRFEFGFGLSYTNFEYSGLFISGSAAGYTPHSGHGSSLDPPLHDKVITVSFTIRNNGTVAGHEIPQLYLSPPASANSPPNLLKGFDSVFLVPGQARSVSLGLSRYDLSTWNVVTQRWEIPSGTTGVSVGASSRDIRLRGSIHN
ncbi:hypothetical protein EVG20_g2312 [Dentipellis fragilis]|uniref:beta-glucosidase n=1 Tax=Dentipellis fragilis TaxID=205917 RepID=A0A4Y9Z9K9_9AGAM|nr:hypothetical protein EVG20_g2312 [Dentipellis fragilis]